MIRKSIFNSIFGYPEDFNPLDNYRKILNGQRWKKSKRELFRPAYGFGKKKRGLNVLMPTLGQYINEDGSNLFSTQFYRLF